MKKILLGTTVLVGAAVFASAASAETPKVTLGGFSNFQAGWADDDKSGATAAGRATQDYGFRNSNEVDIKVDGKTDAGLGYGAEIDLEADTSAAANNRGVNATRTFTYLENKWGRVELGDNKSAAAKIRVDASTLAVATGGINGDWIYFVDGNATGGRSGFLTESRLPTENGNTQLNGDLSTYNATKVSYYTPSFAGFQAGVSYTPNVQSRGALNTRADNAGLTDAVDAGLSFNRQFSNNLKLSLAGTYEYASGNSNTASVNNLGTDNVNAFNVGGLVGIQNFSVAGSYGYEYNTGIANVNNASYWTAGGAYNAGPVGLSVTYLNSSINDVNATGNNTGSNDFSNIVFGAEYKLAPGLTPYAEVSVFDFGSGRTTAYGNGGTAVLVGTQLAF